MLETMTLAGFFILLALIAQSDYRSRKIPDSLVFILFMVGAVSAFTVPGVGIGGRIAGMFAASLPLFLVAVALPGAFGGGDVKLMAAAGVFLGTRLILAALLLGILSGGLYGTVCLILKKKDRKDRFAFGPFLCMGIVLAYFWGDALWRRYFG